MPDVNTASPVRRTAFHSVIVVPPFLLGRRRNEDAPLGWRW
jgi:hypothetical protein